MVVTTTKTINYSITKGNAVNSVNATITSTPGCNCNYLSKPPGLLKLLEFILALIALGLVGATRQEHRPYITSADQYYHSDLNRPWLSYLREQHLVGEITFITAQSVAIFVLLIVLLSYLTSTTSAMIVPKTTNLEKVANTVLALVLIVAGVVEVVMPIVWRYDEWQRPIMDFFGVRLAAGVISLVNGLLFIVSAVLAAKELAGPKTL